jgi:hypothetical protein
LEVTDEQIFLLAVFSMIHVIGVGFGAQAQVSTNQSLPEIIKIQTASGKLGRKNREPTEKLSFTEVDLSKYESGRIFADLKVSSGGCSAALVATTTPTEDRRQLVEFARAESGGASTGDLFALSVGRFYLQSKRVNKFFVSGALIPVGMLAWYEKDCVGSYEITVYIKNAKPSCQMEILKRSTIKSDIVIENPNVYISHIKIRPDGLEIKLTDKGLFKALDFASLELAQKAISASESKLSACLGVDPFKLADEIKRHALAHKIPINQIRKTRKSRKCKRGKSLNQ